MYLQLLLSCINYFGVSLREHGFIFYQLILKQRHIFKVLAQVKSQLITF